MPWIFVSYFFQACELGLFCGGVGLGYGARIGEVFPMIEFCKFWFFLLFTSTVFFWGTT